MQKIHDLNQLDWANIIQENDLVMWGQAQAEPRRLTQHLMQQRHQLNSFQVFLGISHYSTCTSEHADHVKFSSYCGAGSNRLIAKEKKLAILPQHYSTFPQILKPQVVLIQVSPANEQGQYSFGLGEDYLSDVMSQARVVIAEVNPNVPWVHSSRTLTEDNFDYLINSDYTFDDETLVQASGVNRQIAQLVATLVPNGATLQLGIGLLPEAVLSALNQHKNLGVHSGIISDGVAKLLQAGVINNREKAIDTGITITGLISGSAALHQFVDQNAEIKLCPTSYTHHPSVLSKIHNLVAINSAIEVDLTGQINAEIANGTYVGAIGGALDFIRAANNATHGCSIIALPASGKNFSRIVARLNGPVSTPRSDASVFVTEYGIADLRGLTLAERVYKMVAIAHPDFRTQLLNEAKQLLLI